MDRYCLDSNFFIEAWNKYYSPDFCDGYWELIADLGKIDIVFITEKVNEEINKKDDNISEWLKGNKFLIKKINVHVQNCLKAIYQKNEIHKRLVDSSRFRSEADPWVIAHAMAENAVVVTKEDKELNPNTDRIKIPNVCENMGVRYLNDFDFIKELKIRFNCISPKLPKKTLF